MTQCVNRKWKTSHPTSCPPCVSHFGFTCTQNHVSLHKQGIRRRWFVVQAESESSSLRTHTQGHTLVILRCWLCMIRQNISLPSCSLWMRRRTSTSPKDLLISLPTSVLSMQDGIRIQKKTTPIVWSPPIRNSTHNNRCQPPSTPTSIAQR